MGTIKGWMLKQRTETGTVWECRGIPKYSKTYHRVIHVGYGTNLMSTKKGDMWACIKSTGNNPNVTLGKSLSRDAVENVCRSYMRAFPQG